MNNETNEEKPRKEITLRQAVQVMRKELVANRDETTAMRAEVAVMRTEIAAIHKVLEESKLLWTSIAESQRIIAQETKYGHDKFNKAMSEFEAASRKLVHTLDELEFPDPLENLPRRISGCLDFDFEDEETPHPDKDKSEEKKTASDENRCTYIHINKKDSSGTRRCCLIANHKGDHLYKCASMTCPGYPWVPTVGSPHPINTCGQVLEELRKASIDDFEQNR